MHLLCLNLANEIIPVYTTWSFHFYAFIWLIDPKIDPVLRWRHWHLVWFCHVPEMKPFFFFFSFVHICIQMADLIFVFICSYTYRERLCETNDTQKWIHGIILITMAVELIGAQSVITSECLRGNLGNHSLCNIDSAVRVLNLIW